MRISGAEVRSAYAACVYNSCAHVAALVGLHLARRIIFIVTVDSSCLRSRCVTFLTRLQQQSRSANAELQAVRPGIMMFSLYGIGELTITSTKHAAPH